MGKKSKRKAIHTNPPEVKVSDSTGYKNDSKKYQKIFCIVIFLFSFSIYVNTLNHEYAFDDSIVITDNSFTKKGFAGIKDLLTKDFFIGIYGEQIGLSGGRYRPLSLLTFAIEREFFGSNPSISHWINVLLYSFSVLLIFLFLLKLFPPSSIIPYITVLLFAVHPIHTEVVANIKSRDEILCLLAIICSAYYSVKWFESRRSVDLMISAVFYFLALLAKETAVPFVILIPLLIYYSKKTEFKKIAVYSFLPIMMVLTVYLLIRTHFVGSSDGVESMDIMENPFVGASFSEKFGTIGVILLKYLKLLVFPIELACDYSYNQIPRVGLGNFQSLLGWVLYFAAGIFALISLKSKNMMGLGVWIYLATLSLTTNIVFNIGAPMAERFVYASSLGFCLFLSVGLTFISKNLTIYNISKKVIVAVPILIIILLFSVQTVTRNTVWKNNMTLFSNDVEIVPNNSKIHYYFGNVLFDSYNSSKTKDVKALQTLELSKQEFIKSITINPKFHWPRYNLARVYSAMNKPDSAIYHLNEVLKIYPTHIASHELLGNIYGGVVGNFDKAVYHLEKAVSFEVRTSQIFVNLGVCYGNLSNFQKALENFQKANQIDPNNAIILLNLGMTQQNLGNQAKAQEYLNRAYMIDPSLRR